MRGYLPMFLFVLLAAALMLPAPARAEGDEVAGSIRTLKGQGSVIRHEASLPAEVGMRIFSGDTLRTAPESSMGILFRDETSLSLGPASETVVDDFVFDPAEGMLSLLVGVSKGTAAFISGEIAKLRPEAMVVSTPLSTLGIRGTRFVVKVEGR